MEGEGEVNQDINESGAENENQSSENQSSKNMPDLSIIDHHIPDELLGDPTLERYKGKKVAEVIPTIIEQRKMISKGIWEPPEDAEPEVKEAFHQKLGKPKTPEEYQLPEIEVEEGQFSFSEEDISEFKQYAHAANLTQAHASALYTTLLKNVQEKTAALDAQAKLNDEKAWETLSNKWLGETETRKQTSENTAKSLLGGFYERFNAVFGGDAQATEVFYDLSKKLGEASIQGTTTLSGGGSGLTIQEQIDAIMTSPAYRDGDPTAHKRVDALYERLTSQAQTA